MADLSYEDSSMLVEIGDESSGFSAEVDSSGRLKVIASTAPPVTPPAATEVTQTAYSSMSGTQDTLYTITNGTTLTITQLQGGAEADSDGTVIELYEDPNVDLSVLNVITVIFASGVSNSIPLADDFTGDGTRRILLRRRRLTGGSNEVFGRWTGYEI